MDAFVTTDCPLRGNTLKILVSMLYIILTTQNVSACGDRGTRQTITSGQ